MLDFDKYLRLGFRGLGRCRFEHPPTPGAAASVPRLRKPHRATQGVVRGRMSGRHRGRTSLRDGAGLETRQAAARKMVLKKTCITWLTTPAPCLL